MKFCAESSGWLFKWCMPSCPRVHLSEVPVVRVRVRHFDHRTSGPSDNWLWTVQVTTCGGGDILWRRHYRLQSLLAKSPWCCARQAC